jgi:hypothetical protein
VQTALKLNFCETSIQPLGACVITSVGVPIHSRETKNWTNSHPHHQQQPSYSFLREDIVLTLAVRTALLQKEDLGALEGKELALVTVDVLELRRLGLAPGAGVGLD